MDERLMGFCMHIDGVTCDNCRHFVTTQPPTPLGPFKCPDCGTWWAGSHRCDPPMPVIPPGVVWRIGDPHVGSADSTSAPYCPQCAGWHLPGMGECNQTYS